jgi:hypothetical protein
VTIPGGYQNTADGAYQSIGGGRGNTIDDTDAASTIAGGSFNWIKAGSGGDSFIGAGQRNTVGGYLSSIAGGYANTNLANASTIWGGYYCEATSSTAVVGFQVAGGRRAKSYHRGSWVFSDSIDADFASTGTNQLALRFGGGVWLQDDVASLKMVAGTRFVTNVDAKAYLPSRQGDELFDVGSGILYRATGATTNDWLGFQGVSAP